MAIQYWDLNFDLVIRLIIEHQALSPAQIMDGLRAFQDCDAVKQRGFKRLRYAPLPGPNNPLMSKYAIGMEHVTATVDKAL